MGLGRPWWPVVELPQLRLPQPVPQEWSQLRGLGTPSHSISTVLRSDLSSAILPLLLWGSPRRISHSPEHASCPWELCIGGPWEARQPRPLSGPDLRMQAASSAW